MGLRFSKVIVPVVCSLCVSAACSGAAELKKNDYLKKSNEMGVVLLDVNWGRRWGCGSFENAQLASLKFEKVPVGEQQGKYSKIFLESPSRLFVDNKFLSYGFMVKPGKYAFTGWSVKAARSVRDVGYFRAGRDKLVNGGSYPGGTFEVAANEVIYIGNMFLDCLQTPIPWRYYTEGKDNFLRHEEQYKTKFKFLKGREITYRLLDTRYFGSPYSLRE
ncbi:hypothetical protein [Mariprofundus ferrooxydans]|uniref:Lipoprotein n=1 Tax=Mariprofundus ferrooxydans PV-1 TaxID=314345 RepID=Q0F034_9PROT|nr:hypothetical protein [Mariprofundus ferrooxydans]EAU54850.1 hypothetical protein SPV1_09153 [Mariprofundus ferrooxydans PV-1]KON46832.1 hypothetical protein AL013_11505 [Mariprofundus ferrooxydans]